MHCRRVPTLGTHDTLYTAHTGAAELLKSARSAHRTSQMYTPPGFSMLQVDSNVTICCSIVWPAGHDGRLASQLRLPIL